MNTALKVGLSFQALQFSILIGAVLVWALSKLAITGLGVMIFILVSLNLASLVLIISGMVNQKQ
jgi:hypothetical protein